MLAKALLASACGILVAGAAAAQSPPAAPPVQLWRLDCGSIQVSDFDVFSDTYLYEGQPKSLTASCYLIRHGDQYLLWDTGVSGALVAKPSTEWVFTISLKETIVDQLKRIGIAPDRINYVGISHYHDDHTGQAADFPRATLLIGSGDWEAIKGRRRPRPASSRGLTAAPRWRRWRATRTCSATRASSSSICRGTRRVIRRCSCG